MTQPMSVEHCINGHEFVQIQRAGGYGLAIVIGGKRGGEHLCRFTWNVDSSENVIVANMGKQKICQSY